MRSRDLPYGQLHASRSRRMELMGLLLNGASLKVWYRPGFKEVSSNWIDSAGIVGNATTHSGIAWVRDNNGLLVPQGDGTSNSWMVSANNVGITGTSAVSFAVWLTRQSDTDGGMMGWGLTSSPLQTCGIYQLTRKTVLAFAGGNNAVPPTEIPLNKLTFLAITKASGTSINTARFYYDGVYQGASSGSSFGPNIVNGPFYVGQWADYTGDHCVARYSQIMVYNRELSAGEVKALYDWFR